MSSTNLKAVPSGRSLDAHKPPPPKAVLTDVLLLLGGGLPLGLQLSQGALHIILLLWRRQAPQRRSLSLDVFATVAAHPEKGSVGVGAAALQVEVDGPYRFDLERGSEAFLAAAERLLGLVGSRDVLG
jgi:hypothetical protein